MTYGPLMRADWIKLMIAAAVCRCEAIRQTTTVSVPVPMAGSGFHYRITADFTSINVLHHAFLFVLFAPVFGYGNYAATMHDWRYTTGGVTRKEADAVLYRALRAEGVARWRAWLPWAGVRIGGAKQYTKTPTSSGVFTPGEKR